MNGIISLFADENVNVRAKVIGAYRRHHRHFGVGIFLVRNCCRERFGLLFSLQNTPNAEGGWR
jgi:hypothetical protein